MFEKTLLFGGKMGKQEWDHAVRLLESFDMDQVQGTVH